MKKAARLLGSRKRSVLLKGGHLKSERKKSPDLLFHKGKFHIFESERIPTRNTHGTGCVLSSAIAASLAKGADLIDAVGSAKNFIMESIRHSHRIGKGVGPVNPFAGTQIDAEKYRLLLDTERAFEELKSARIGPLIPEIQSNLATALENARDKEGVIGFPSRIICTGESITAFGRPVFGGSAHVARIALTVMHYEAKMRSSMNIRYSRDIIHTCKRLGFKIGSFDRKEEPKRTSRREGLSLEWGVSKAIEKCGSVPDIIYDRGGIGKEPVSRVIGSSPQDVASKVIAIRKRIA